MPVVNECKCVGSCHRLPHYREVTSDDWGQRERDGRRRERKGERVGQWDRKKGRCTGEWWMWGDVVADVPR